MAHYVLLATSCTTSKLLTYLYYKIDKFIENSPSIVFYDFLWYSSKLNNINKPLNNL